jgi:endoglucanase
VAYILGASGHSYVAGYGCNPPRNPHHRNACLTLAESDDQNMFDTKEFNEYELTGAVVGGPDITDHWVDDRKDYKRTEVAIDYNAALFFAAVQVGR